MIVVYYYRTTRPEVLAAYTADEMVAARIEAVAQNFADQFGAKPFFTMGFDSHFAGIGFDKEHPCRHPDLWSKARDDDPRQVPRSPERAGAKMRAEAERLHTLYDRTYPKAEAQPRVSELVRVLQLLEGKVPELLVYHEVAAERAAYLASSVPLADLDEVTASQFITAQRLAQSPFQPVLGAEVLNQVMKDTNG